MKMPAPLLDVRGLAVEYATAAGPVRAVDGISFTVAPGEIMGLAGESGCGKSTAAHAILRLLRPPARIVSGKILFGGRDLARMNQGELRSFRWKHSSIVFQSAMNSLNPVLSIGTQLTDTIRAHEPTSKAEVRKLAGELLEMVGIDRSRLESFPHELSGGMRQRVVIAMALALHPELVVLDEPTTALDVVVQREILQEIQRLQKEFGFAALFITHDLSLLVEFSDRIAIMYAGEIVEQAPARELFRSPKHPYTAGLMQSFPPLHGPRARISGIAGFPPDLANPPSGCRFHPRCMHCTPFRARVHPALRPVGPDHMVACHLYDSEAARD
jgi:peptide/nickel transport system ATP-binding protein